VTNIIDNEGNQISLDMFNYSTNKNLFFSKGTIKIVDKKKNEYNFSEIFIDEKQNKIVGTDVKVFLKQSDLKENTENEPRFFANSMTMAAGQSKFEKGIFTYCKDKGNETIPAWCLQSKRIKHDASKKTIYYDDAVIKVYDFPIFYFPKLSHPDPTVDRRSGFLTPTLTDSSNVGPGFNIPYFWAISKDKDLTVSSKFYTRHNHLLLSEYRQDFEKSFLIVDTSYTDGYKDTSLTKSSGSRAHFFSKFNMNFFEKNNSSSELEINLQQVSNDTYLKIHDINTTLVNKEISVLENTINYDYNDEDLFLGINFSAYDDLTKEGNRKYEYLLPFITFDKNLLVDDKYGTIDLSSKLQVRNFDVDKQTEMFVNDFIWSSKKFISSLGIENEFKGLIKGTNYKANNTNIYKTESSNSELSGALGVLSKLDFYKDDNIKMETHLLSPKMLFRHAPGHMRNIKKENNRLRYDNLFEMNKVEAIDVVQKGTSASLGFNYSINKLNEDKSMGEKRFEFSAGQVINLEENTDMSSQSSMDQRFSDVVGTSIIKINDNLNINYNFAVDQNLKKLNYNDIGIDFSEGIAKFNLNYYQEKEHIGNSEYLESNIDLNLTNTTELSFSNKRNLITNSSEFYSLSYNYLNDCLKAGLVYRREFYTDRDIEPEDSLMFRITLTPLGGISTPTISR
jgi:LPS-assembly protein